MTHTPIYVMPSLILQVFSLPYQIHHHDITHEVAVLDKKQDFPQCQMVLPRRQSFLGLIGQ